MRNILFFILILDIEKMNNTILGQFSLVRNSHFHNYLVDSSTFSKRGNKRNN